MCDYEQNFSVSRGNVSREEQEQTFFPGTTPPSVNQSAFRDQENGQGQRQFRGLLGRYSESAGGSSVQDANKDQHSFPANDFSQVRQEQRVLFDGSFTYSQAMERQSDQWNHQQERAFPPPDYATQATNQQIAHSAFRQRRHVNGGFVVGIVLLVVAFLSGSVLGYMYFFSTPSSNALPGKMAYQGTSTPKPPKREPLFTDNFTANAHQWNVQSYPGEFSVSLAHSALTMESDNNRVLWEIVPGEKGYGNFQLSVDAVLSKGSQDNGYGMYIRSSSDQNGTLISYYRFELYGDGTFAIFKSGKDVNAVPMQLVAYTSTPAIEKQGKVNHVNILAQGQMLRFSVNGYVLSTVSDASYTSGAIALFVSNLQNAPPGAQVQFSHLAIYSV